MRSIKNVALVTFLFCSLDSSGQSGDSVQMADILRQDGKIYTVVFGILIILTAMIILLIRVDRKIFHLERDFKKTVEVNSDRVKTIMVLLALCLASCGTDKDAKTQNDSLSSTGDRLNKPPIENGVEATEKFYSNARFRNVKVARSGPDQFTIQGEAQIFEANFGWAVEDGHHELKNGFEMTDAGAPAWGKFDFTVAVQKPRSNSTLTLILFESSAKDGSRQFELPIALE